MPTEKPKSRINTVLLWLQLFVKFHKTQQILILVNFKESNIV